MRIISGILKGKTFEFLKTNITRPLKDSVRENIFNILAHSNEINVRVKKAKILDLYSGIGSFGIECISREANLVNFVEQDTNAINVLKKNLLKLSITDKATIINDKIENILNWNKGEQYNIFFFDPPFQDNKFIEILKIIKENKIYMDKHIVIIHRDNKSTDIIESTLNTIITKKYGRSKIIFGRFN